MKARTMATLEDFAKLQIEANFNLDARMKRLEFIVQVQSEMMKIMDKQIEELRTATFYLQRGSILCDIPHDSETGEFRIESNW